jgi:uridine kinase
MSPDRLVDIGPALAEALAPHLARLDDAGGRLVIGVAGESGSGKSTTAIALADALRARGVATGLLHQDNYFFRPPRTNHAFRLQDLGAVGPHEVDLARIAQHVAAFRAGTSNVDAPVVNYPENRFDHVTRDFAPLQVLIVEGTYVLMLEDLDVRVFLQATHRDTHERRMARNRDLYEPIIDTILDIEHGLIAPQSQVADWLIDRAFRIRRGHGAPPHAD